MGGLLPPGAVGPAVAQVGADGGAPGDGERVEGALGVVVRGGAHVQNPVRRRARERCGNARPLDAGRLVGARMLPLASEALQAVSHRSLAAIMAMVWGIRAWASLALLAPLAWLGVRCARNPTIARVRAQRWAQRLLRAWGAQPELLGDYGGGEWLDSVTRLLGNTRTSVLDSGTHLRCERSHSCQRPN